MQLTLIKLIVPHLIVVTSFNRFRVQAVDDNGFRSNSYKSLPTNGSTPTSSRPQTPQQASTRRGPPSADNFQQSNSWMEEEAGEPPSISSPSMYMRASSAFMLPPSAELQSSIFFPKKPATLSLLRTRSLASIPEETDFNNTTASALSSSSCSRMIQIEETNDTVGKVDCQIIADDLDVSHVHLSVGPSAFSVEAGGESVSWTAKYDDSQSSGAHNANNYSFGNRNNSSMTCVSRRDAVLARLTDAANHWSPQFWLTSLPTGLITRTTTLLSGRWPTVIEPRSLMAETEQSLSNHVDFEGHLPPPVVLDTEGFQTADLFSATDDRCTLASRDIRLPRRVGPFNYAASGTR